MNDMIINKLLENMRTHRLRFGSQYPPTLEEWDAINTRLGLPKIEHRSHDGKCLYHGVWVRLADQDKRQRDTIMRSPSTVHDPYLGGPYYYE